MEREFLKNLGIEDKETLDKIMSENGKDIQKAKGDKETLESEIKILKEQMKERDEQLENLKNATGDVESLKKEIETLQTQNKEQKEAHEKEVKDIKIHAILERVLTASGSLNNKATMALIDLAEAELTDDGEIKGLDEKIKALKEDEATSFLFSSKEDPLPRGFNPADSMQHGEAGGRKDVSEMSYEDFLKAEQNSKGD